MIVVTTLLRLQRTTMTTINADDFVNNILSRLFDDIVVYESCTDTFNEVYRIVPEHTQNILEEIGEEIVKVCVIHGHDVGVELAKKVDGKLLTPSSGCNLFVGEYLGNGFTGTVPIENILAQELTRSESPNTQNETCNMGPIELWCNLLPQLKPQCHENSFICHPSLEAGWRKPNVVIVTDSPNKCFATIAKRASSKLRNILLGICGATIGYLAWKWSQT